MSGFWIREIRAYRRDGHSSHITLDQGLNIIAGPSNTGKTRVAYTIDFLMGGDRIPFTGDTGYHSAEIDMVTENGEVITLRRSLGSDTVVSPQANGEAKVYNIKRDEKDPESDLNSLLVSLLDLKTTRRVIKNSSWKSQTLTWRSLYHLLWFPEDCIDRLNGTILRESDATHYSSRTTELSTILVLAQDENYDDIEEEESDKDRRIRQRSVKQYIAKQLEHAHKIEEQLNRQEEEYRNRDIEVELAVLNEEFDRLRAAQIELNAVGQNLVTQIKEIDENIAVFAVDRHQREEFISQLEGDLHRLEFLAEASIEPDTLDIQFCGYCKQPVHESLERLSNEQIEIQRAHLQQQLVGARSNLKELEYAIVQLSQRKSALIDQHANLQNEIALKITSRQTQLTRDIQALKQVAGIQARLDQLQQTIHTLTDFKPQENEKRPPYKPLELFDQDFFYSMNSSIRRILSEIGFPSANAATFDEKTLDITIDGYQKETKEGKGFAALLNTVVIVAFHEYLDRRSKHSPHFLFIDSPLKNFDDSQLKATESMRVKLLQYIARTSTRRQVILCENNDRLVDIDLEKLPDTNIIRFSKNPYVGRYGYLEGVYEPGEDPHDK